ncbi:DUF4236 domain-containing protein [Nevskia soli]|jgi:hypothetical protein|uniref:DUF4236 domain-containing protein n=1 Tax=Nevskia soli TaxID=418856 RepID=UPI0015D6EEEA
MSFFFRKSGKFGPFRLNFSKSGIGASVGVRGARLTMTPGGKTYVTIGADGFYYRETISQRPQARNRDSSQRAAVQPTFEETFNSSEAGALADSSAEKLVNQLNERSSMFNPAWLFLHLRSIRGCFGLHARSTFSSHSTGCRNTGSNFAHSGRPVWYAHAGCPAGRTETFQTTEKAPCGANNSAETARIPAARAAGVAQFLQLPIRE